MPSVRSALSLEVACRPKLQLSAVEIFSVIPIMGSFPFLTPLLVFPGITSQTDNFSNFCLWLGV